MRLVLVSDTHCRHSGLAIPDGDVLIHAGDLTPRGALADVEATNRWLDSLPHRHKVVIAGNHDFCFESDRERAASALTAAHYLQDEALVIEGIKLYGSPWQPRFHDWAFNLPRGEALRKVWERIPEDTEILVTHGPPWGVLDRTSLGQAVGCQDLRSRLESLPRLRLHVFGHIHEAYGVKRVGQVLCVNACICDLGYRSVHPPVVVDWEDLLQAKEPA